MKNIQVENSLNQPVYALAVRPADRVRVFALIDVLAGVGDGVDAEARGAVAPVAAHDVGAQLAPGTGNLEALVPVLALALAVEDLALGADRDALEGAVGVPAPLPLRVARVPLALVDVDAALAVGAGHEAVLAN